MVAVRVMQVAVDEVVDMVAVRYCFMAATWAVYMAGVVAAAFVLGSASIWVLGADFNDVLVDMVAVRVMEVAIVQVIDVVAVFDGGVAAVFAVLVVMMVVVGKVAVAHGFSPVCKWIRRHVQRGSGCC